MAQRLIGVLIACLFLSATASAASIQISGPHAMAQPNVGATGGVSLTIVNKGAPDKLVSIKTPAAKMAQLHNNKMKHGKMRMRRTMTLDIAANSNFELRMDGMHIMLMGLTAPLTPGSSIPMTLVFEKAGEINVSVPVK